MFPREVVQLSRKGGARRVIGFRDKRGARKHVMMRNRLYGNRRAYVRFSGWGLLLGAGIALVVLVLLGVSLAELFAVL